MVNISVIGLGKLGSCLATSLASKGFSVFGFDVDKAKVEALNKANPQQYEKNLKNYLKKYKNKLNFSTDLKTTILKSDVTFIVVNTPSNKNGDFSNRFLEKACKEIGKIILAKKRYHLIVIVSTVMPNTMKNIVNRVIEKYSKKKFGKDYGLCYNPEFIALGSIIHDLLHPDFILIGESDKKAGDILAKIYNRLLNKPKIKRMSLENAEIAKIALNSYITTKISFANQLAQLCQKIPGTNVDVITDAIGNDRRIGTKYFRGGMSYGGPCFPRDSIAFINAAKKVNCNLPIVEAVHKFNLKHSEQIANIISSYISTRSTVAILGASYKPNTDVIDESPSLLVAKLLKNKGFKVKIFDPVAIQNVKKAYGNVFEYYQDIEKCLEGTDALVVGTMWSHVLSSLNNRKLTKMRGNLIFDCWRYLDGKKVPKNFKIIKLGAIKVENKNQSK